MSKKISFAGKVWKIIKSVTSNLEIEYSTEKLIWAHFRLSVFVNRLHILSLTLIKIHLICIISNYEKSKKSAAFRWIIKSIEIKINIQGGNILIGKNCEKLYSFGNENDAWDKKKSIHKQSSLIMRQLFSLLPVYTLF